MRRFAAVAVGVAVGVAVAVAVAVAMRGRDARSPVSMRAPPGPP